MTWAFYALAASWLIVGIGGAVAFLRDGEKGIAVYSALMGIGAAGAWYWLASI